MRYKKYDPSIKNMIINSRNPNLFPELNIPRTTAIYWIKSSKDSGVVVRSENNEAEVMALKREVFKEKTKSILIKEILELSLIGDSWVGLKNKTRREKLIKIVEGFKDIISVKESLKILKISNSRYYRYRAEVLGCQVYQRKCEIINGKELSISDQKLMIKLALNPQMAHFSLKSLMFYAQREKILMCGIDSWYKYLRINKVKRPYQSRKEKIKYGQGIRANMPNELWHMDVTLVRDSSSRKKLYIQLVVDNYSRAILSYKIGEFRDLKLTLQSLNQLSKCIPQNGLSMMTDGGGENINKKVNKVLLGRGITHLVAKSNIVYSNSIVEAVFRQMKKIDCIRHPNSIFSLKNAVKKYVYDHNYKIPHSSLAGAKPFECLNNKWDSKVFRSDLNQSRKELFQLRQIQKIKCLSCVDAF